MIDEAFSRCALMRGLSPQDVERVYAAGTVARYRAGETVIAEGQVNTRLFVVLQGEVEVCLPARGDRFTAVRLARLGSGSCMGEYSFIDQKPTSAAVVARADTE